MRPGRDTVVTPAIVHAVAKSSACRRPTGAKFLDWMHYLEVAGHVAAKQRRNPEPTPEFMQFVKAFNEKRRRDVRLWPSTCCKSAAPSRKPT